MSLKNLLGYQRNVFLKADLGGVYLIPEGLIEFLPDVKKLLEELETLKITNPKDAKDKLKTSIALWDSLPDWFQKALFTERDPHGNFPLSQVKTEELLIDMVKHILLQGDKKIASQFSAIGHFFGYEGRCCFPTPFDCAYTFALGVSAAVLILWKIRLYGPSPRTSPSYGTMGACR